MSKEVNQAVTDGETEGRGNLVITKNSAGVILAVTRQDSDGKILDVIAESTHSNDGLPPGERDADHAPGPARSIRADVRNPLLALPAAKRLANLPADSQAALKALLIDLRNDCRIRAEQCWVRHKAPMASYFKAVGVYANHTSRLLKGGKQR